MLTKERKAASSSIRVLWAAIKQQKTAVSPASKIVKYLMTEGGLTELETDYLLDNALEDGLLEIGYSSSSTSAKSPRKSPTRNYKIPSKAAEIIKDLEHDLYCFECHTPKNLQKCSLCPRTFHEQCNLTDKTPQSLNNIKNTQQTNDSGFTVSVLDGITQTDLTQDDSVDETEEKVPLKVENTSSGSSSDDKKAVRLLPQAEDVICIGEVRPPSSRRNRRLVSSYEKPVPNASLELEVNGDNNTLCKSCRLQQSTTNSDPPIQAEEMNFLLKFIFDRIKSWITSDTYSPLPFSPSIPMPSKQELELFERTCLKFPKTLDMIDKKLKANGYKNLTEFQCDFMDIQHSMGIIYGVQSAEFVACMYLVNDCSFELSEIRKCSDCYRHSNEKSNEYWFCKPCVPRHELVFAKQIGYSHWPAKVIKVEGNRYDVRFFGKRHLRAEIDGTHVLPIDTDLKLLKAKKTVSFNAAMEELHIHQELLQWPVGKFSYEAERTSPVDLSSIRPKLHKQTARGGGKKRSGADGNSSIEMPSSSSISIECNTINTTAVESTSQSNNVSASGPNNSLGKRKRNNITTTESVADVTPGNMPKKRTKPNANSTPLKKRGKAAATPIHISSSQNQSNGQESEVSSTQDSSHPATPKPSTPARIKSKIDRPKQDVVENLVRELQQMKCPPAACKLVTETMHAEIEKRTNQGAERIKKLIEKHNTAVSEIKKKQWCYHCEKEAIYYCCWNTAYCSTECQQKHWQMEHKKTCRRKR